MTQKDIERKQLVLIEYLQGLVTDFSDNIWKVKAEYSTNDNDKRIITVQETQGRKIVFYGECAPLFNYYIIDIYGLSIQENKNLSLLIGSLIGKSIFINVVYVEDKVTYNEKWQIIFKQYTNPQAVEYMDIKRIGYNAVLQCIVNKVASTEVIRKNRRK